MVSNITIENNSIFLKLIKPKFRLLLNECYTELHCYFKNTASFEDLGIALLINTSDGWQFFSRNLPIQILEFEFELNRKIEESFVMSQFINQFNKL